MGHHHTLNIGPLTLQCGEVLPETTIAYACYGTLAADGSNAKLLTHGYTASHRMLAKGEGIAEGAWASLYGPGEPFDPQRDFIVCPNMLGSSYGSTGPASINPNTGQPYRLDFPPITIPDIVASQKALLEALGVTHLRAVVGPSMGGFQALQWAVDYPDWVDAAGVVVSAPWSRHNEATMQPLLRRLSADPAWHDGRYDAAAMQGTMRAIRKDTLREYGMPEVLAARGLKPDEVEARIERMADTWSRQFDPGSLIALRQATMKFDVRPALPGVRADVLLVVERTDVLFPPDPAVQEVMRGIQGRFDYLEMNTGWGHSCSGAAHAVWRGALLSLLDSGT